MDHTLHGKFKRERRDVSSLSFEELQEMIEAGMEDHEIASELGITDTQYQKLKREITKE